MSEVKEKVKGEKRKAKADDPISLGRAIIDGSSFDEATNSVSVVFATDTPVLTRDWDGELFYEVLSMDKAHIRQERISSGAPVLDNHDKYGSVAKVVVGVVESPQIVNKEYRATLRFSKRKSNEELVSDIKDKVIVNVSAGYRVYGYRDISAANDKYRTLLAIDWEPTEISMVPVPADYKAKVRSAQYAPAPTVENPVAESTDKKQIELNNNRALKMEENEVEVTGGETTAAHESNRSDNNTAEVGKAAAALERKRGLEIRQVVRAAKLDDSFADTHIEKGTAIDEVRKLVIEKWAESQRTEDTSVSGVSVGNDRAHEGEKLGLSECLQIRSFGLAEAPKTEIGKVAIAGAGHHRTLMGIARGYLDLAGINHSTLNDMEVAKRAMTSTDFPLALQDAMNKTLKKQYTAATPQWKKYASQVSASDFKNIYGVRAEGSFMPQEITEEGEYKMANFKETGDHFALKTWGIMTAVSRKMIINDDLGAFTRFAPAFSNGMTRMQAKIVSDLLTANGGVGRTLAYDGLPLFDAGHKNYDSVGATISTASLKAARLAFMRQVGLNGEPIEVDPKYLIVPPELSNDAWSIINGLIVATKSTDTNQFKGMFEIIEDRYLTDPKAWYLAADPGQVEIIKYATLNGQDGIFTEQEYDFKTDKLLIKARTDFNATIEEPVGIYKNKGA